MFMCQQPVHYSLSLSLLLSLLLVSAFLSLFHSHEVSFTVTRDLCILNICDIAQ